MRTLVSLILMGSFPAELTKPLAGTLEPGKHWSWPAAGAFATAWDARRAAGRSYPVLMGKLRAHETQHYDQETQKIIDDPRPDWSQLDRVAECVGDRAWFLLSEEGLEPLLPNDDWCQERTWKVVSRKGGELQLESDGAMALLTVTSETTPRDVPEKYLTDWTYAATLLKPAGKSAALLEEYEKNAPIGGCSMDRRPQQFASEFADKCYEKGELACYLTLQVRVMGDQFQRVAYSSYGEAAHETQANRLEQTGIDVDRFFRGLVVVLPGERGAELSPSRLARALLESSRREKFERLLVEMAQDESLDTMNRYRAFITYVSMQYRAQDGDVEKKVAALKVDALSKAWWDAANKR